MPNTETVAFPQGMVHMLDPLAVPVEGYHLGINVALDQQALAQRHGVREVILRSDDPDLVEEFQRLNFQGAISYSPSRGQSALQFSSKAEFIAIAAGGRKFLIEIIGRGAAMYGILEEITGNAIQAPDLHMNWMGQAENYLIAGDDFGATYIYDSENEAFFSSGYDPINPELSRVPNRMRSPVYTHARLAVVVDACSELIGDIIHGGGETDASALLNFSEQVYWASGAELCLPTDAGPILASYNLPTTGNASAHGDHILEAEGRAYAVRTQLFPRTEWINSPNFVTVVSAEGAARGPWAFDVYNDDAIRRTLSGLETLSFSRRASDIVYTPQELISHQIDPFLRLDYGPLLRFNSTKIHRSVKRLYTTVRPWISGYHWKHRGLASFNYLRKQWEGINVYPKPIRDVKCLVPMRMRGEARLFMIAGNDETGASIRVLEIDEKERQDHLEDSVYPVQSAVYTRAFYGDLKDMVEVEDGELQFSRVLGEVSWQVLWKSDWSQGRWTEWNSGTICHTAEHAEGIKPVQLGRFNGREINGVKVTAGRHFQFLIRWTGQAELRFHNIEVSRHPDTMRSIIDEDGACTTDPFECDNDPLLPW